MKTPERITIMQAFHYEIESRKWVGWKLFQFWFLPALAGRYLAWVVNRKMRQYEHVGIRRKQLEEYRKSE